MSMDAEIEYVIHLFLEDTLGKAERRYLAAHKTAAAFLFIVQMQFVSERGEVPGDGQRRRAGTEQCDLFAVWRKRPARHQAFDITLVVCSDPLKAANRHRFLLVDPSAPAGRFAGAVAGAAEDAGKHVRIPVDHVR